jgi:hypothetical protein
MLQLHDEVPSATEDATNLHTPGSLQADINSLTYWSESFQMSFNLDKCHVLHLGKKNPKASYTMYKTSSIRSTTSAISYYLTFHQLTPVDTETDLRVVVDNQLKFSHHVDAKVRKANRMLGIIKHTFKYMNKHIFTDLYKSLIRPHLEYATPAWSPHLKRDKDKLENVQRRSTKIVPELKHLTYEQRLTHLKLPTLHYRRLRSDLLLLYKLTHSKTHMDTKTHCTSCKHNCDMLTPSLSKHSRPHNLKYQIQHHTGIRNRFYTTRTLPTWNKLKHTTVNAASINIFKTQLESDPAMPEPTKY